MNIPEDYPVQPLTPEQAETAKDPVTCGNCGRTWDDGIVTGMTPAPSARCPFEAFHEELSDAEQFFYDHAGFSWNRDTETAQEAILSGVSAPLTVRLIPPQTFTRVRFVA